MTPGPHWKQMGGKWEGWRGECMLAHPSLKWFSILFFSVLMDIHTLPPGSFIPASSHLFFLV
jgi:hypothetical protein